jgi:hypothetical protein
VLPQSVWLVGLALFFIVGVLLLAYAAALIARGKTADAERAISTRSAAEEVEDEIRDLQEREAGH